MARKKQPPLDVRLRRAEKSAGNTKWALEGAGARRNPPSPERAKALREKLDREQALVAGLRAERDTARAKAGSNGGGKSSRKKAAAS